MFAGSFFLFSIEAKSFRYYFQQILTNVADFLDKSVVSEYNI